MNRTKGDEEEYWNSSKFKAFTFDDEDDELSQLKESKRAVNSLRDIVDDDDDDDLERVSWTGEPVGSISWSIKETAGSSGSTPEGREQLKGRNSFYTQLPKPPSTYSLSSFFRAEDAAHVQDHYTLLERQIIIEANDRHLESSGQTDIFRKHPRKASILNMPLVTTLFYACFYHYTESEGTFSSPINLKKTFKIPDKQYVLTALAARAKLRAWNDVDALFTTKNWLGYTKKRAPIGFHRVVEILHKNSAPVQILQEYVNLVEDVDTKLNLATKFKCHDVVIDTCRDLKDRQQLLAYRSKVDKGSAEEEKIDAILSSSQIRWKN